MNVRDDFIEREAAPHSPIALFDEFGRLHGWSPAFGEACSLTGGELGTKSTADFWPEIDARRWSEMWHRLPNDGSHLLVRAHSSWGGEPGDNSALEIGRFVCAGQSLAKVELRRTTAWRLHRMQQEMLEEMASGAALKSVMETLCRRVEALIPSVTCSIMAITPAQQLLHIASPSLPLHYQRAVDGIAIGPKVGSCGTAAFRGESVEVEDIDTDPLWEDYKHLALPLGLRACWSSPIQSSDGRVIGAFGFYYPRPRSPSLLERQIVAACLHLCMIAFEQEETRTQAYELAFTDTLTRLPNRMRFQQRVGECLATVAKTGQRTVVHYVGLDRFRPVNDMHGYEAGDELLKVLADRLGTLEEEFDGVARIGGDEFALVHVGPLSDEEVADRARRVIEALARPLDRGGEALQLGASVGIAIGPGDAASADKLIHNAALAMRQAKELRRGSYCFYEKDLNDRMQRRLSVEADLRNALSRDQLELHFQPIFDIHTGEIAAAEALLRWNHPERGMVRPAEFIPLAEQYGIIEAMGAWAIRQACHEAAKWPAQVAVAVNLSPRQFESPGLARIVASALKASGLDPTRLELEITETVLLGDSPTNIAILDELSDMGISIALDDFGSGYSSLSYLHRFRFDRVKIDHSFIRDIGRNDGSLKIVRAIVMLAHSLGLKVTAEGIETDDQLAAVRGEGCDAVQGYYTGSPMPLADFTARLIREANAAVSAA
jgi:diguanylate cyclase (GGDEF)-like protein